MSPDQTPTPETDAAAIVRVHPGYGSLSQPKAADMVYADFARTLEHQRDTALAEAKEAKKLVETHYKAFQDARAEVERLTSERNHQNQQACAWAMRCGQLEKKLATLRATRDADHGEAIEAAARALSSEYLHHQGDGRLRRLASHHMRVLVSAITNSHGMAIEAEKIRPIYDQLCSLKMSHPHLVQLEWLDTLKALVTNSQQKGEGYHRISDAEFAERGLGVKVPTSDPEGAATPELFPCPFCGSAPNSALRQSHDEFGEVEYAYHEIECTNRACGVLPLVNENLEADDGEEAWQKAFERAAGAWNQRAAGAPTTSSATPSPTHEKLAQEIDDLYEAPSRIRPLRRILEREFGASRSVAETAKEIMEHAWGAYSDIEIKTVIESILSRFREHELLALKAVLEQRTAEANLAVAVGENLQTQLESSRVELRELREECAEKDAEKQRFVNRLAKALDDLTRHKAALKVAVGALRIIPASPYYGSVAKNALTQIEKELKP